MVYLKTVLSYIVDMSSLLASIAYFYVCFIGFKITDGPKRFLSLTGALVSMLFIGLLVIPGSPSRLGLPSMLLMLLWAILGFFYYKKYSKVMR